MGKDVASAQGDEKQALLARTKEIAAAGQGAAGHRRRGRRPSSTRLLRTIGNVVEPGVPAGGEDDYVVARARSATARDFAAEGFEPRDHLELGRGARRDRHGARREGGRRPVLLPQGRRRPPRDRACSTMAHAARPIAAGFIPMITPDAGQAATSWRAPASSAPRRRGLPPARGRRPLPRRHVARSPLAGYHADEILDLSDGPDPLRRLVDLLPPRGRLVRQGHPRHHPRAPVQQGRDVRLLPPRGRRGRARAPARLRGGDARSRRAALPRHRHRGRRPRLERGAQVRLRGVGAHAGRATASSPRPRTAPTFQARRLDIRTAIESGQDPHGRAPSTARSPPRAGSSRSSRTTSRPTARSSCPRRCARTSASTCLTPVR